MTRRRNVTTIWLGVAGLVVAALLTVLATHWFTRGAPVAVEPPRACPVMADDPTTARWHTRGALSTPDTVTGALVCLYGSAGQPTSPLSLSPADATIIRDDIAHATATSTTISCPMDTGDHAQVYLLNSGRAYAYTIRLTGCPEVADRTRFAGAGANLIDTLNRVAPNQVAPAPLPGPQVTTSSS